MAFFSPEAFEHLLFPLHQDVYRGIENGFLTLEQENPGLLQGLIDLYALASTTSTSELFEMPSYFKTMGVPVFDLVIKIDETDLDKIKSTTNYITALVNHETYGPISAASLNVHLVVHLHNTETQNTYIVPLPFVMEAFKSSVVKKGSYQLYQHLLVPKLPVGAAPPSTREEYITNAATYVGLTKRTWQKRYKEHLSASRRGSLIRFHRAIRGEFFDIHVSEHEILRAGLSEEDVLRLEEIEVQDRSLYSDKNPNGLNMIPGGKKGIRFICRAKKIKANSIDIEHKDLLLEDYLNDVAECKKA